MRDDFSNNGIYKGFLIADAPRNDSTEILKLMTLDGTL